MRPGAARRFRLRVVSGLGAATPCAIGTTVTIGSHEGNDLVLPDATVSRFHGEVGIEGGHVRIRDLASRNGTLVDGLRVVDAYLAGGCHIRVGRVVIGFDFEDDFSTPELSPRTELGRLWGASVAMRQLFATIERAAATDATVLIEGETGCGKEEVATALHGASRRAGAPMLVVDCAALPPQLLESELFGHERGAFTGASERRAGLFEEADGGTIFLDEVGELPLELQPRLLRVLERRQIRRVGSNSYRDVDVRVIAATHRDLREAVNAGTFREDLYFRLAVVRAGVPPLRARAEDIPELARRLLRRMGGADELLTPGLVAALARHRWPGNVRELRNYLERCLVLQRPAPLEASGSAPTSPTPPIDRGPYEPARRAAIERFERSYLQHLLEEHRDATTAAAATAQVSRVYLWKLLKKHGLR